jgi:outer membrane lipoprotein-sorting protein
MSTPISPTNNLKNWWLGLLIGALLGVAGALVWRVRADDTRQAAAIVRRWLVADRQLSYTASEISEFRIGKKLVRSEALVARRPHMRRIHYLTPPLDGITIWRKDSERYYFDPKKRQLEIFDRSQHRHGGVTRDETLVLRNYEPRLEGIETVAGRTAYRIWLSPRHRGDAWMRIWVDRQTGARLGDEDWDGDNRLLRSTRFTQISFESIDPDQFRPPQYVMSLASRTYSDEAQSKSVAEVSRVIGFPIKLPRYVPDGYILDGAYTYPCQCGCEKPAAQVCWTNGLKTISVFECGHPCGRGAACSFTASPRSASVGTSIGNESFLFVGETSRAELEKMARSLRSSGTGALAPPGGGA